MINYLPIPFPRRERTKPRHHCLGFALRSGLLLLLALPSFAQNRTVSGRVTAAEDGSPLPGVSVTVKGTTAGTQTDADGRYQLSASEDNTLVFSYIGTLTQEIRVGSAATLDVVLVADAKQLSEVVVTAFGIAQERRAVNYAVQQISSDVLTKNAEPNVVNALQGKVAGAYIQSSGGAAGAGTTILIRGLNSISPNRSSSPLFVIDGVPISNETYAGSQLPSSGSNSPGSNEQYSNTNRAVDLNPNDIESLSVLKGPAATALYGLRAANGAVIITTKRAKVGAPSVRFNTSVGWDEVNKVPGIQRQYREGTSGVRRIGVAGAGTPFQTFGPKVTENDPVYDNFTHFFRTGLKVNNDVGLSGATDRASYTTSASHLYQKGIVPNSDWKRTTVRVGGSFNINDKLSVSGAVTYSNSGGSRPQGGDKSVMSALNYHTTSADVNDYINPDGSIRSYAGSIIDNPRYLAEFSTLKDNVNRNIGNVGFTYKPLDWLTVDYKLGADIYSDSRTRLAPNGLDISSQVGGFVIEDRNNYREINSNLYITATKSFGEDLKGSLLVGNNLLDIREDVVNVRGEGFTLAGNYSLNNTVNKFTNKGGRRNKLSGVFADAKLEYKGTLYLSLTGRNDWSTTLPKQNRSFFYPSVNLGYLFTESLGLSNSNVFNYGKLRVAVAGVGKDASAYQTGTYFQAASRFPFNGVGGVRRSTTSGGTEDLQPESTTSLELGTELRFFGNRLSLDLTYYKAVTDGQIVEVPISNVTGYAAYITNAGEIRNEGFEALVNATPVRLGNFSWDVSLNWSRNKSEVLSLPEGLSEIVFQDDRIVNKLVVGGSAGDLYGRPYRRDAQGRLLIDANGYPTWTDAFVKVGNALPDWQGGVTNTFTYRALALSFLVEVRQGGDVYDTGLRNRLRNGVDERTAVRDQQVVFEGVTETGEVNAKEVILSGDAFYRNPEARYNGVADILLQDASWVRLRNASLSYLLTKAAIGRLPFQTVRFTVSGNNLVLLTKYRGFDPEGTAYGAGSNSFGYSGLNIPATRNVTVAASITF
ncbi:MAG: SusC/RagA family TonB-linked outer membrane protein [Ferruginibacter sp.]|nr:SusC/RagA family TonB-linked outer membrane protein [Cytophagales bacterium]